MPTKATAAVRWPARSVGRPIGEMMGVDFAVPVRLVVFSAPVIGGAVSSGRWGGGSALAPCH